jgi:hypothetical protein
MAYTEGYPYFIQGYGSVVWNFAATTPITRADVGGAREAVEAKLDESFFRVRADRTTDAELKYCVRWPNSARNRTWPATSRLSWVASPRRSVRLERA